MLGLHCPSPGKEQNLERDWELNDGILDSDITNENDL